MISQAGKTPVLVDVDAFALQNAYEVNYDVDPRKVVALVNIGACVTNVNILARGQTVVLARHLRSAATSSPRRCSGSSISRFEQAER